MTLSPLLSDRCPDCDTGLGVYQVDQPALFIHGGYGASVRTILRSCPRCGWQLIAERGEVRP